MLARCLGASLQGASLQAASEFSQGNNRAPQEGSNTKNQMEYNFVTLYPVHKFLLEKPMLKDKGISPCTVKGGLSNDLQLCVLATVHGSFKLFNVLSCLYFSG